MYLQELVEVAIGLVFAWLMISIAVMQAQEIVAGIMGKRSKDLEMAIQGMLDDPEKVKAFYNHPLIQSLSKPKALTEQDQEKLKSLENKQGKLTMREQIQLNRLRPRPAYIPSSNFASALFDVVIDAGTEKSPIHGVTKEMREVISNLKQGDKEEASAMLDGIYQLGQLAAKSQAGIDFQNGVKKELQNQIKRLGDEHRELKSYSDELIKITNNSQYNLGTIFKSDLVVDQLRVGAQALLQDQSKLGESINSLLTGVEEYAANVDQALAVGRKNVEAWFNNTMDRMGGWYKRWAQVWSFFIALAIAIAFNIDSIYMAQELWRNPALRQASATYIQNYVDAKTKDGAKLEETDLKTINAQIQTLDFPIGWERVSNPDNSNPWAFWFLKVAGWLITAIAAMQGAPFWFDTLKKLVNVRSNGPNPAEKPSSTPTEREKD